jgi:hypothetical protein
MQFVQKCTFFDPRFKVIKTADRIAIMDVIEHDALQQEDDHTISNEATLEAEVEGPPRKKRRFSKIIESAVIKLQKLHCRYF